MKKLSAVVKLPAEINKFVAVTNGPEFCLETALLFNDTHNSLIPILLNTYPSRKDWLSSGSNSRRPLYNIPTTNVSMNEIKRNLCQDVP